MRLLTISILLAALASIPVAQANLLDDAKKGVSDVKSDAAGYVKDRGKIAKDVIDEQKKAAGQIKGEASDIGQGSKDLLKGDTAGAAREAGRAGEGIIGTESQELGAAAGAAEKFEADKPIAKDALGLEKSAVEHTLGKPAEKLLDADAIAGSVETRVGVDEAKAGTKAAQGVEKGLRGDVEAGTDLATGRPKDAVKELGKAEEGAAKSAADYAISPAKTQVDAVAKPDLKAVKEGAGALKPKK